jgi:hypothetical protein
MGNVSEKHRDWNYQGFIRDWRLRGTAAAGAKPTLSIPRLNIKDAIILDAIRVYMPNSTCANKASHSVNLEAIKPISDAIIVLHPANKNVLDQKPPTFRAHVTTIKTSEIPI